MGRISRIPSAGELSLPRKVKYLKKSHSSSANRRRVRLLQIFYFLRQSSTSRPKVSCLSYPSCQSCYFIFLTENPLRSGDYSFLNFRNNSLVPCWGVKIFDYFVLPILVPFWTMPVKGGFSKKYIIFIRSGCICVTAFCIKDFYKTSDRKDDQDRK